VFKFLHINSNYGIVLKSKFIIIAFIVLYCTNPLIRTIIYYLLHCDWCIYHH